MQTKELRNTCYRCIDGPHDTNTGEHDTIGHDMVRHDPPMARRVGSLAQTRHASRLAVSCRHAGTAGTTSYRKRGANRERGREEQIESSTQDKKFITNNQQIHTQTKKINLTPSPVVTPHDGGAGRSLGHAHDDGARRPRGHAYNCGACPPRSAWVARAPSPACAAAPHSNGPASQQQRHRRPTDGAMEEAGLAASLEWRRTAATGWGIRVCGVYIRRSVGLGGLVFMWAAVVLRWAADMSRWAAFSCRVHANTACRDRGPDTAHYRVMPILTIRPSC
jgi:hypothetical protein